MGQFIMKKIKLVDAIADLRKELYEAHEAGKEHPLKLDIDGVEIEFAVEIAKQGEVGGELSFYVPLVEIDGKLNASGELGSQNTHRIKLHLKPKINDTSVEISGETKPQED